MKVCSRVALRLFVVTVSTIVGGSLGLLCRSCTDCKKETKGNATCYIPDVETTKAVNPSQCQAELIPDHDLEGFFLVNYRCADLSGTLHATDCNPEARFHRHAASGVIVYCCKDKDLCNDDFPPAVIVPPTTPAPPAMSPPPTETTTRAAWLIPVSIAIPVTLCVVFVVVLVVLCHGMRRKDRPTLPRERSSVRGSSLYYEDQYPGEDSVVGEEASDSVHGKTRMAQVTISKQTELISLIGSGRYGEVWKGKWSGSQDVAVKIFNAVHERSFNHEVDIYMTTWLRHENVLGFIAADNRDDGMSTQLWMVTDYCYFHSLLDYITNMNVQITVDKLLKILMTASRGLTHIHSNVTGSVNSKPAMAHRDVKSRNFLVRRDGSVCIADLGLAVRESDSDMPWNDAKALNDIAEMDFKDNKDSGMGSLGNARNNTAAKNGFIPRAPFNYRVGTRRYMAPEILNETMVVDKFESFRRTDVYSFALVMWEVCRRTILNGEALDYEQPYQGLVPSDPELEDMIRVVNDEQCRPTIPEAWRRDVMLSQVVTLMEESWCDDSRQRSSMARIRKKLEGMVGQAQAARRESRESTM